MSKTNDKRRYCAEITSHPETLEEVEYERPCARQPFDEIDDCPTCGVAWAKHGGAR